MSTDLCTLLVTINGVSVQMLIDTGATVSGAGRFPGNIEQACLSQNIRRHLLVTFEKMLEKTPIWSLLSLSHRSIDYILRGLIMFLAISTTSLLQVRMKQIFSRNVVEIFKGLQALNVTTHWSKCRFPLDKEYNEVTRAHGQERFGSFCLVCIKLLAIYINVACQVSSILLPDNKSVRMEPEPKNVVNDQPLGVEEPIREEKVEDNLEANQGIDDIEIAYKNINKHLDIFKLTIGVFQLFLAPKLFKFWKERHVSPERRFTDPWSTASNIYQDVPLSDVKRIRSHILLFIQPKAIKHLGYSRTKYEK
ncbi:hypothetical protein RF11_01199 [Thelohanellus kitauei]|uniref:Uncharacterized protein n=1 Tax=Thelohanellus kitauei TaxID=669202 RepID=A0A0C2IW34_THEKT|nr:hypothetical protein RF11_01199 [Thelohanellus kitauei]